MNNKRIYEDKVKPLSSLFISYYGSEYKDQINNRFNKLNYNFDSIFTPSNVVMENSPNTLSGLIYKHQFIKNKKEFDKLYDKYIKMIIECVKDKNGIDISNKYRLLVDEYFSIKNLSYAINDDNLSYKLAEDLGTKEEEIRSIFQTVAFYRFLFFSELLNIKYFGDLNKRLNCERKSLNIMINRILEREPFLCNYVAKDKSLKQYLFFPYLDYKECQSNLDTALIHELIHLVETHYDSKEGASVTGLTTYNKNMYVNEIRTDLLAKKIKENMNGIIFEKRDIDYNGMYLKAAKRFLFFFEKYERVLANIAITGDLDKLIYYFSSNWDEFSKMMDDIWCTVEKEASLHEDGYTIDLHIDTEKIFDLINKMEQTAQDKVLIK